MSLQVRDAVEIAWAALLDEVGEPFVPNWHDCGLLATVVPGRPTTDGRPAPDEP